MQDLRRRERGSNWLDADQSPAASQTDRHGVPGPPLTYSRGLLNAFSRKDTTPCNVAAQGNPILGEIQLEEDNYLHTHTPPQHESAL